MTALLRRYADPLVGLVAALAWIVQAGGHPTVVVWCGVGTGAALAVRRRTPLATYLVVLGLFALAADNVPDFGGSALVPLLTLMLALASLGLHARGTEAWLGGAALVPAVVVLASHDSDHSIGGIFFFVMLCAMPWGAGLAFRLRLEQVRESEARHAAIRQEAGRAVAQERARIARELHDVVSHAIAVTVLQSRGARALVDRDDDSVRATLQTIERTNVAALADMRRLLALLRSQDPGVGARDEPAPTLDRLDQLVETVRASGLPVELSVAGEALPVPPGLDLSAYRIVQEALTNVLTHAGPDARAQVEVHYGADDLTVAVTNSGAVPEQPGTGHGLAGIRERVAVAGGTVVAGPADDGYAVRATLPYLLVPV